MSLSSVLSHPPTLTDLDPNCRSKWRGEGEEWGCPGRDEDRARGTLEFPLWAEGEGMGSEVACTLFFRTFPVSPNQENGQFPYS